MQHDIEVLKLREQFAREKAAITLAVHNKVDSPVKQRQQGLSSPSKQAPSTPSKNYGTAELTNSNGSLTYEANAKLLEQLDMLRGEQRKLQDAFAEERFRLQCLVNFIARYRSALFSSDGMRSWKVATKFLRTRGN